ncbi:MAG: hypothetical protein R2795_09875 [Saprospiraceae bacterium]
MSTKVIAEYRRYPVHYVARIQTVVGAGCERDLPFVRFAGHGSHQPYAVILAPVANHVIPARIPRRGGGSQINPGVEIDFVQPTNSRLPSHGH